MRDYYRSRAESGAGLIITEGMIIHRSGDGWNGAPHIETDIQAESWRMIADAVHQAGGSIACQLWHMGRISHSDYTPAGPVSSTGRAAAGINRQNGKPYGNPRVLSAQEMPTIYSYFAGGLHAGAFTVGLQTRPDQAREAVKVSRDVIARFVAEGPTEAELRAAKDNLIGGFALRIDSNKKLLGNVANIAWNELPLDYLDQWTKKVEALTVADVRAAMARKLQPERMVTVVVGGKP